MQLFQRSMRGLVLGLTAVASGCSRDDPQPTFGPGSTQAVAATPEPSSPEPSPTSTVAPVVFDIAGAHPDGDLRLIYDAETGCEYIAMSAYKGGRAITPRLTSTGNPKCGLER